MVHCDIHQALHSITSVCQCSHVISTCGGPHSKSHQCDILYQVSWDNLGDCYRTFCRDPYSIYPLADSLSYLKCFWVLPMPFNDRFSILMKRSDQRPFRTLYSNMKQLSHKTFVGYHVKRWLHIHEGNVQGLAQILILPYDLFQDQWTIHRWGVTCETSLQVVLLLLYQRLNLGSENDLNDLCNSW